MKIVPRHSLNKPVALLLALLLVAAGWGYFASLHSQGNVFSAPTPAQGQGASAPLATPFPSGVVGKQPLTIPSASPSRAGDEVPPALPGEPQSTPQAAQELTSPAMGGSDAGEPTESGDVLAAKRIDISENSAGATESVAVSAPQPTASAGILSNPIVYLFMVLVFALMLLLTVFRVSFAGASSYDASLFKVLSSDTRMEMLYSLQAKRKTLTQLAEESEISVPGAKQHLQLLEERGLVRKLEEGRKWKYYELTEQGRSIVTQRNA